MRKIHHVTVNGEEFTAFRGDVLLDAALMNGIEIPHDCRSGHCGTCSVRVITGELFGNGDACGAKACQCRIISDVDVAVDDVPEVTTTSGHVADLKLEAPDVISVCIAHQHPIEYLPGQYFQVKFRGFPVRCYSPTVRMDRPEDRRLIHLHVGRVPGGHVSSALGLDVKKGHRVKLKGPFGSAHLRYGLTNRLVLVAGGTGFAPIWSIAEAALRENRERALVLIAGARSIESLYMIPALWRLADYPNTRIIPVLDTPQTMTPAVQTGLPTDYLPEFYADDVVYTAGPPGLVEAVKQIAQARRVRCYADPFLPNSEGEVGVFSRAANWLLGDIASPSLAPSQGKDIVRDTALAARASGPRGGAAPLHMSRP